MQRTVARGRRLISVCMMATLVPVVLFAGPAPAIKSAEKSSFQQVTRQLNSGGQFYSYMSTQGLLDKLPDMIQSLQDVILAEMDEEDPEYQQAKAVMDILGYVIRTSGVDELSGIGISSIARAPGQYYNRAIYHHYPGQGQGRLWSLFGGEPITQNFIPMLPQNTAMASYWKMDVAGLVDWIRTACKETGHEQFAALIDGQFEKAHEQGLPAADILQSMRGEFGIVLTLNPEKTRPFEPEPNMKLDVPDLGIAIVTRVSNAVLLDTLDRMTQANANIEREEAMGAQWRSTTIPVRVPVRLNPTLMQKGSLLVFASNKDLAMSLLEVPTGAKPALTATETFKKAVQDVPTAASSFHYVSPILGDTLKSMFRQVMTQAEEDVPDTVVTALSQVVDLYVSLLESCGATVATEEGFVFSSNSSVSLGRLMTLQSFIMPAAMAAGMVLPAISNARLKAREVSCLNNLRQLGTACMMYAQDHDQTFPDGLGELVREGYLGSPEILTCPNSGQQPAPNPEAFNENLHSSYVYLGAGAKLRTINDPSRTVIAADKPGNHPDGINILFADSHVARYPAATLRQAVQQFDLLLPGK